MVSSIAAGGSALVGGSSHNVATYVVAALILGVYFALNSGTLGITSPRLTYLLTVPFAAASAIAFLRFREPLLHRAVEPVGLRRHVRTTLDAMTRFPLVRRIMLLFALTELLSSAVFEFGPLWLVDLHAPPAAFGPYWAALVATLGVGGYLAGKLDLDRRRILVASTVALVVAPIVLATGSRLVIVAFAQTTLALVLAILGIYIGRLLHDAVPSAIRAGVSSGAGTLSWVLFLPFSLAFGVLARSHGVESAAWLLAGVVAVFAALLVTGTRAPRPAAPRSVVHNCDDLIVLLAEHDDGTVGPGWRARIEKAMAGCDGHPAYRKYVDHTATLLAEHDARPGNPVADAADGG